MSLIDELDAELSRIQEQLTIEVNLSLVREAECNNALIEMDEKHTEAMKLLDELNQCDIRKEEIATFEIMTLYETESSRLFGEIQAKLGDIFPTDDSESGGDGNDDHGNGDGDNNATEKQTALFSFERRAHQDAIQAEKKRLAVCTVAIHTHHDMLRELLAAEERAAPLRDNTCAMYTKLMDDVRHKVRQVDAVKSLLDTNYAKLLLINEELIAESRSLDEQERELTIRTQEIDRRIASIFGASTN